jgi:ABC-type Zn uptake system ZnuABC Zn-binding protein ZnuA
MIHNKNRLAWLASLAIAVGLLLVIGCGRDPGATSQPTAVVTTIWPLADLAQQVLGESGKAVALIPPGASPHGFEPTGRQVESVRGAKLIVAVGMGFDGWIDPLVQGAEVLEFSHAVGVEVAGGDDEAHAGETPAEHAAHAHEGHNHGHEGHDAHTGPNPHLWLDPVMTAQFVAELADHLAEAYPQDATGIQERAAQLVTEINAIDAEYREALAKVENKRIVTFHNAFDRLAARYDIEVAATLAPVESLSSLTPARMETVLHAIEEGGLRAIFSEPQFPDDVGRVIENEADVKVLTLDPIGNPHQPDRASYQLMMRYNLRVLLEGLNAHD